VVADRLSRRPDYDTCQATLLATEVIEKGHVTQEVQENHVMQEMRDDHMTQEVQEDRVTQVVQEDHVTVAQEGHVTLDEAVE